MVLLIDGLDRVIKKERLWQCCNEVLTDVAARSYVKGMANFRDSSGVTGLKSGNNTQIIK